MKRFCLIPPKKKEARKEGGTAVKETTRVGRSFLLYFSLGHHLQLRFRILMEVKQITTKYQMEWEYQINSTLAFMKILQYKESLL